MIHIPAPVSALLHDLSTQLPTILGRNLVGVYLYGSLTQNAFDPARSDVDCLVVTKRELSEAQFRRVNSWLVLETAANSWTERLQATFLIRDEVLTMGSRACLYQFGRLTRCGSDGNPIVWMNVLDSGVTLFGPPAVSFVPEVTLEIMFNALERELAYLREEISRKPDSEWRDVPSYRAYAVHTLCRILYSLEHGTVASKPRAASWALAGPGEPWSDIIGQACSSDSTEVIPLSRILKGLST